MVILGIDPGSNVTGYGVIHYQRNKYIPVEYGVIKLKKTENLGNRLKKIFKEISELIERLKPDEFAVESVFHGKNVQSLIKLSQARTSTILAAALKNVSVSEYSPREVKMAVTGSGASSKEQVQFMMKRVLGLAETPKPADAADALAVALCHAQRLRFKNL